MSYPTKSVNWNPFGLKQWISWIVATFIAAMTMTTFVYSNFETKQDSQENRSEIERRLDRMENKIDQLLVKSAHSG